MQPGWPRVVLRGLGLALALALLPAGTAEAKYAELRRAPLPACTIAGTQGDDTLVGTSGDDVICGRGGDDTIRGRGGDDKIYGGPGNDRLDGGAGNDRLYGYRGRDRLRGGAGKDALQGGPDADSMAGGSGPDTVDYFSRRGDLHVTIGSKANDGLAGEGDSVRGDVEGIRGGHGDDVLTGNKRPNRIHGGGGDDVIKGGRGNDRLWGDRGNDRLLGRDASRFVDWLRCGRGNDVAVANGGDHVASSCENGQLPQGGGGGGPVNHAPKSLALSPATVAENLPAGTAVGTLTATDQDAGQHHTFELVPGAGSTDNGAFTIDGPTLRTAAVFDREAKSTYSIRVRARDDGTPRKTVNRALTVTVTNVNEAPFGLALAGDSVAENRPAGTAVGTLSAGDPDAGDAVGFSLVPGAVDNAAFAVDGSTLRTGQVFDFETKHAYTVRVRATDLGGATTDRDFAIAVTDTADPPTADSKSVDAVEDTAKPITLSGSDPDGDPLTFKVTKDPAHGTYAGGIYTPDPNYNGDDAFEYVANDGTSDSAPATVSIAVAPVNDVPVAEDASAQTAEDTPLTLDPGPFVSDVETADGDLTFDIVDAPQHGDISGDTYTPDENYNGPDSFTYKVTDRGDPDDCTAAPCDAPATSDTKTVSITVNPVNDAPTADSKDVSLNEDGSAPVTLTGSDVDLDPLTFHVTGPGPQHGSFVGGTYTPAANYNGPDSFQYVANDGTTNSAPATVSITVNPVNDAPVAIDGTVVTDEDTAAPVGFAALVSDVETADDDLDVQIVDAPQHGDVSGDTYTPDADYNGPDSFTYKVTDRGDPDNCTASPCDGPKTSATKTVSITVNPENDAPAADDKSVSTNEDTAAPITLSGGDADSDPLTFTVTQPANGVVTGSGASRIYTPKPDFNGTDSFTYVANDGTVNSAPATVTVTVAPVNDTPLAADGDRTTDEDTPLTLNLASLVSDVETPDANLTYAIVSQPAHGTATGTTYTPNDNYNGPDSLTYKVTDRGDPDNCSAAPCDGPESSVTRTVSIAVAPVNDAPTAAPGIRATDEDTPLTLDLDQLVSDVETSDADLTYEIVDQPAHGTATPTTYTPTGNYNGPDSLTYKVTDRGDPDGCSAAPCDGAESSATRTVSITVAPVNDAPVATDGSRTTDEDTPLTLDLASLVSDVETPDANLTYEIVSQPAHGTATETTYTPNENYNGPDSFTYKVTDRGDPDNCSSGPCSPALTSATKTVSITVDPVNDAPAVTAGLVGTNEDTPVALNLDSLVSDIETADGDLTYEIVGQPAHGTATATTYTPNPDFNGTDGLTYRVTDRGDPDNCGAPGAGCDAPLTSGIQTVTLSVAAVNDAPINTLPAGPLTATQDTNTPITGASIADVDSAGDDVQLTMVVQHGTLTVSTSTPLGVLPADVANNGESTVTVTAPLAAIDATLNAANGLVYHGDAAYTGSDELSFSTDDLGHNGAGNNKTDTDTLAINVVPPNAAPVAAAQSVSTNEDTPKLITLSASDADGDDPLSFAKGTGPSNGTLGGIGPVTCDHATPTNTCTAQVTYTPNTDFNGTDSFTFTANDGKVDSAPATVSITVDPVNDAPKLQNTEPGGLGYTENDPATVITATTTVADDSPDFDTGTLTVDYTAGGSGDDRLDIRNQGTGAGQIGVNGSTVTFGGADIGTFTGGTGTSALVVTLNAAATPAAAQALIRNVTYRNVADAPTANRTARFVLADGDGGTSNAATRVITVAAVNDPPVVANVEAGALPYQENDLPKAITSSLTISDPDNTNLASATVQITGNYQSGFDKLAAAPQFGVTPSFDTNTGTLTLTGSTTLANYQTILRSVTYENTSDAPSTDPRTVTFKVSDGAAESAGATRGISVTAVDDAPTLTTSGGSTAYTEQDPATVIDGGLNATDPDGGADPTGATVKIVSPAAGDELVYSTVNGITGSFASGTLTLSGTATLAQYEAALRSVQFRNLTNDAPGASRSIEFKITTPVASNTATKSIAITQVNDAPSTDPTDAAGSALEQIATALDSGIVVTDPDSANLTGATVQITGNFQAGQDTLQFTNQNGITGNISGSQVTLTGTATVAQYQTALRSITYTNTSDTPNTLTRTVTFRVSDDGTPNLQSAAQTRNFDVVPVNDAPTDTGESQNATGNTRLEVELTSGGSSLPKRTSATGNLLDNAADVDDAPSALSVDTATVSDPPNGTVSVNADGSYVYTPDVGFTGADSFTYKVKDDDGAQSAASTVSITVANRVWYVKNDFAGTPDGRSETPFTTLAAADTAADQAGDTIYVLRGTGTNGLTDTVDLLANQRLLGEAQNLVVGGTLLFTGSSANRPPLTGTVNLASGNTVSGVSIAGSGGVPAIAGATGDASGTIADVQLSGASGGLDLNGTSGTWDLSDLTVNTTGGTAVNLNNSGTVNFTPAGTISLTSASGPALTAAGTVATPIALSGTIDSVTTTSSATTGISLTNTTGSLTLDDVNLTTTGTGLTLNNASNVTVNNSGDADITSSGTAVNLTNGPTTQPNAPDVALDQVSSSGGSVGINIDGIGAGTFTANGGTLSGHSSAEIDINGGSGNITYPGTIGNGSGLSVQITGRSGGTVALSGNINDTNDTGGGIDMGGAGGLANTGGTFNFSGTTKTLNTGTGAAFSSAGTGTGPTINLTGGGLDIDTTSGNGLSATGAGTIIVTTGTNPNTIDTGSGTALTVTSTSIGASGLTFRSIAANAAPNGIVLNTTGNAGGLSVTGTGTTAGSGGTIQGVTNRGVSAISTAALSLANMNFTNDGSTNGADPTIATSTCGDLLTGSNTGCNAGIHMDGVSGSASFTNLAVNGGNQIGINGNNVSNLTLSNSTIQNAGDQTREDGVRFRDLKGTSSITNSTLQGNEDNQLRIANGNGATGTLTISGSTFQNSTNPNGEYGFQLDTIGTGNFTTTIGTSTFNNTRGGGLVATAQNSSTLNVTASGGTWHGNAGAISNFDSAIQIVAADASNVKFNVHDISDPMLGYGLNVIHFQTNSPGTENLQGQVVNTVIGDFSSATSASTTGAGIGFNEQSTSNSKIKFSGNNIKGVSTFGITMQMGNLTTAATTVDATVQNNTISVTPAATALQGIFVNSGTTSANPPTGRPEDAGTFCADISGNVASSVNADGLRVRQRFGTTVRLPGYSGGAADTAAVNAFLATKNPSLGDTISSTTQSPGSFTGGAAACAAPTLP